VKVRILLSNAFLDPRDPKDNTNTVAYVNDIARRERLDMEARLIRTDINGLDKIHNKGVIVDGRKVLVSSVNWSLNSPLNNREVSLLFDHQDLGNYFTDIFMLDWHNGTAADHLLITEIDAALGFVEISNPTAKTFDLSGWKLTTVLNAWTLPANTTLQPGQTIVIARDSNAFRAKFGTGITPIQLPQLSLNQSSETLRLQQGQTTVDLVAWGGAYLNWTLPKAPLCRPEAAKDTNTQLDWVQAPTQTPGTPGC
jgi:hypothetical protein